MIKQIIRRGMAVMCILFAIFYTAPAYASCGCNITYEDGTSKKVLGVDTLILGDVEGCSCDDGSGSAITKRVMFVLNLIMGGVALLGTIGFIIVGFMYLTARDNEAQVATAKKRVVDVTIGLVIYAVIWAGANLVIPGDPMNSAPGAKIKSITALSPTEVAQLEEAEKKTTSTSSDSSDSSNSNTSNIPNSSSSTKFITKEYDNTSGSYTNFLLFTPNTAQGNKLPLIVYLHGDSGPGNFDLRNIVGIKELTNWESSGLQGINAYMMFPQTKTNSWRCADSKNARNEVWEKVKQMVSAGKVNPYKVSIMGQSSGSFGVQCFVMDHIDQFSAAVMLSGYKWSGFDPSKAPAMKFIYGTADTGSANNASYFKNYSHIEVKSYSGATHDSAVGKALKDDSNPQDGKSDLIEWALSKTSKSPVK